MLVPEVLPDPLAQAFFEWTLVMDDSKRQKSVDGADNQKVHVGENGKLARELRGRHMQMIAVGGTIGAGLFVSTGSSFTGGGPASVLLGFSIVGCMLLFTIQAMGELAVLYPVNGAFFTYTVRFIDPAWGFAIGWNYAIGWLTTLPFELTAASLTIQFWRKDIDLGVWIGVFMIALIIIQAFGVRGYGEVEFVLSIIKIIAICGFIILGIVINCGGVPTDNRGYIGGRYWRDPGAFFNGFAGFCSVFVNAAFAFGGTELVGLAAAEAANPRKVLPLATKQVFWRITFFYVISLLIVGLIVPADEPRLLDAKISQTEDSPFVLAIILAGIPGLPSVMNAVITISVLSAANSCTYGSTRTIQALAQYGMAPKFFGYVDKKGRPLWGVALQLAFGLLAFIGESGQSATVFIWLLSISGLSFFFVWGSICFSHIRFRRGWAAQGYRVDEIPYQAQFGVVGSWIGVVLVTLALIATFYVSLYPLGGKDNLDPETFFETYLSAFLILACYLFWKAKTLFRGPMWVSAKDMDVTTSIRELDIDPLEAAKPTHGPLMRVVRSFV